MSNLSDAFNGIPSSSTSNNNLGGTSADGDSSYDRAELAKLVRQQSVAQQKPNQNAAAANAGTTTAGQSDTSAAKQTKTSKPGKRAHNPLSKFSSSTYQLTLYMVTPDAYAAFVQSGRRNINVLKSSNPNNAGNGAYIVAQSGGVNTNTGTRAPGFDLDYYIDDLKITTLLTGADTKGSIISTAVNFTITEPYGFSFMTKLGKAKDELAKVSTSENFKDTRPDRQFFILGIRFQGYDKNGKVMTGKEVFAEDTFDPNGNSDGIFERFFDIAITEIKFKLGTSMTTYYVTAKSAGPQVAFTYKRGLIKTGAKVEASTIDEALQGPNGLLTKLNKDQVDLMTKVKAITKPTRYSVVYLGEAKTTIANASLISKADLDKSKTPLSTKITNIIDSNPAFSTENKPNTDKKIIQFRQDEPVLQAINQLIAQSSYLRNALTAVEKNELEPAPADPNAGQLDTNSTTKVKWYNISAQVIPIGYDNKINDFTYDITYIIQPYETPVIVSTYANKATKYYGPYKKYEYFYTGQNSEVLSFEQTLNNNYFTVVLKQPDGEDAEAGGLAKIPTSPSLFNAGTPRDGRLPGAMEAENNYLVNLTDPAAWAKAKIRILGDPDYLMQDTSGGTYVSYDQFYGPDGYTINPAGGQVFVEIDFKEGVDYKNSEGTLSINDSITFGAYTPDIAARIDGVSYQVLSCASSFKDGKFVQELDLKLNTFEPDSLSDIEPKSNRTSNAGNGRGADPRQFTNANQTAAVSQRTGVDLSNGAAGGGRGFITRSVPTPTGTTADDDSSSGEEENIPT